MYSVVDAADEDSALATAIKQFKIKNRANEAHFQPQW
jgi:hypothetical protein